jgi:hypothetical protein
MHIRLRSGLDCFCQLVTFGSLQKESKRDQRPRSNSLSPNVSGKSISNVGARLTASSNSTLDLSPNSFNSALTSFISFLCVSLNDENPSRSNKASRSDFDDNACASPSLDVISAKDFVVVDSSVLRSLTCVWTADSAVRARSRTSRDEEGR